MATAHRLAGTVYFMLKHHVAYVDLGAQAYNQQHRQRELLYLTKKAAHLGFRLIPAMPTAPSPNTSPPDHARTGEFLRMRSWAGCWHCDSDPWMTGQFSLALLFRSARPP